MLNPYAKFHGCILKGFKDMLTLISHVSSVLVQYIISLDQAVTSQAEKREPIKIVFIVFMPEYLFRINNFRINRVFSRPVAWPVVTMETVGQTNQRTVTAGAQALSAHYIMLIRPPPALPLVRIYRKLFIFKYLF